MADEHVISLQFSESGGHETVGTMSVGENGTSYTAEACNSFTNSIGKASEEIVRQVAEDVAEELQKTPPTPKRTGKYARGWKAGDTKHDRVGECFVIVANHTEPSLTHLLEHGHGGPHPAHAQPHIEAAYEKGKAEFEQLCGGDG
jgi:hypothetical protein